MSEPLFVNVPVSTLSESGVFIVSPEDHSRYTSIAWRSSTAWSNNSTWRGITRVSRNKSLRFGITVRLETN